MKLYKIIIILIYQVINRDTCLAWILYFDVIPSSTNQYPSLSIESCNIYYWTKLNTPCFEGCCIIGNLKYGINFITNRDMGTYKISDFKIDSIAINCRLLSFTGFKRKISINSWVPTDICILNDNIWESILNLKKSSNIKMSSLPTTLTIGSQSSYLFNEDNLYIGAYYIESTIKKFNILKIVTTYFLYGFIIDIILIFILITNFTILKFRLNKLEKQRLKKLK
ncbi:hypothetical protein cand_005310 [Cryptosporidium andersoni]|uniref:Uncharacterized protein n=1 Tax=Cryptosporidium andersoni TaxID=117008 RepID=A0A1J4MK84_9CRYT|nr:hypothetical protein cand_005310 [Cryptosporidium andersoni]